jgi:hypothetical protein
MFMIKLKPLLSEIAMAKSSKLDNQLKSAIRSNLKPPATIEAPQDGLDKTRFMEYLQEIQDWSAKNIPEHGMLLTISKGKLYKTTKDFSDRDEVYEFTDDYETFEDFLEDYEGHHLDWVAISTGQIARYLFGADIAGRIVIPGRGPAVGSM